MRRLPRRDTGSVFRPRNNLACPFMQLGIASSGCSLQLVGRAPPIPEGQDGAAEQEMPRASVGRLHRCPTKVRPVPAGGGGGG